MASNTVQEATQVETNEVGVECERGNDDPLRVIYKCLANPATSTHALMGVETAEVSHLMTSGLIHHITLGGSTPSFRGAAGALVYTENSFDKRHSS